MKPHHELSMVWLHPDTCFAVCIGEMANFAISPMHTAKHVSCRNASMNFPWCGFIRTKNVFHHVCALLHCEILQHFGACTGARLGAAIGAAVGAAVGISDGGADGAAVGAAIGASVG